MELSQRASLCESKGKSRLAGRKPGISKLSVMSGGEALGFNVLADVIFKCICLGYNIIQNTRLYAREGDSFNLRLRVQIGIWQAIHQKISDPEIKKRMR